jgi:hypothetical protein
MSLQPRKITSFMMLLSSEVNLILEEIKKERKRDYPLIKGIKGQSPCGSWAMAKGGAYLTEGQRATSSLMKGG